MWIRFAMRKTVLIAAGFLASCSADWFKEGAALEINIAQQTWFFLYAIILGAALGVVYDLFRILRVAFVHASSVVILEDILFWCVAAVSTFGFFYINDDGRIRMFLLAGETIGFVLYYFTIGMLVLGAARRIIAAIKWVLRLVYNLLIYPILTLAKKIIAIFVKLEKILAFYLKKHAKISNIHLKRYRQLLYNQRSKLYPIKSKGRVTDESCTNEKT